MTLGKVLRYLNEHQLFAPLPSFDEVAEGLEYVDPVLPERPTAQQMICEQRMPDQLRPEKKRQIERAASHLWGGHETTAPPFETFEIEKIERIGYARTKPLKITLAFPGDVKRTMFVKAFDEKRLVGLELENILGPHPYAYSSGGCAIYEAEIPGIEAAEMLEEDLRQPEYMKELVALDHRVFLNLLGDVNPFNYLVERTDQRRSNEPGYRMGVIDFDILFAADQIGKSIEDGFVVDSERRSEIVRTLGQEQHDSLIRLQREQMRRSYLHQQSRLRDLLSIIDDSESCNTDTGELGRRLSEYYDGLKSPRSEDFYKADTMGQLLGLHLAEQLNV